MKRFRGRGYLYFAGLLSFVILMLPFLARAEGESQTERRICNEIQRVQNLCGNQLMTGNCEDYLRPMMGDEFVNTFIANCGHADVCGCLQYRNMSESEYCQKTLNVNCSEDQVKASLSTQRGSSFNNLADKKARYRPVYSPTTCITQGKNCGIISDGTNGFLHCGTCTAPQTCGGGGVENVCGQCASSR